jgi:phosphoglucosamine mutase
MEALPAPARGAAVGVVAPDPAAADRYRRAITARAGALDLSGLTIAVDCANGATVDTAPAVLGGLGARVVPLAVEPDGVNINAGCGSTDLSLLRGAVTDVGADLGLAFDGDGDRVLAVDADGRGVDGDQILALCALHLRDRGELRGDAVVATTMSNLGFRRAMRAAGVEVHVADVGDRYVLDLMRERGAVLGGEQSGHLIDLRVGPIGDGLGTALLLLAALRGRPLREAAGVMERFPQRLESVRVARKGDLPGAALVWDAVAAAERDLGDDGRVVVRASGTEPVVRVMVEAPTSEACESICRDVLASVRTALGAAEG